MKLKMLMTVPAGVDGVVRDYIEGVEYEFVSESEVALADLMLSQNYAIRVEPHRSVAANKLPRLSALRGGGAAVQTGE